MRTLLVSLALAASAACNNNPSALDQKPGETTPELPALPSANGPATNAPPATPPIDLDSKDILSRAQPSGDVEVKHVLISWKELAPNFHGHMDPRASDRSNADAAALAQDVYNQLKANPDAIDALVQKYGEDPGAKSGDAYPVSAGSQFVPEFKKLALRLQLKEVGIVRTRFGYHVMVRVPPAPPDPLESADVLARPANQGPVYVQHILIGWKDSPAAKQGAHVDARALARTKDEADQLAKDTLAKLKAGGDMAKLMKDVSEDPNSKDDGHVYDVEADGAAGDPTEHFEKMALRLNLNEVGLARTTFGWHVVKRVPPPPPDSLDSTDILARPVATDKAKVKHILLGWDKVNSKDPRGVARSRADLEKLVKDTVGKLQKGDKIEPLMADLSEDPGSAKSGKAYDVSPTAQLVAPFKNLSLRLKLNEVGVVKSDFGIHIIQRVE